MKISELISDLRETKEKFGDVEVFIVETSTGGLDLLQSVYYDNATDRVVLE